MFQADNIREIMRMTSLMDLEFTLFREEISMKAIGKMACSMVKGHILRAMDL